MKWLHLGNHHKKMWLWWLREKVVELKFTKLWVSFHGCRIQRASDAILIHIQAFSSALAATNYARRFVTFGFSYYLSAFKY